MQEDNSLKSSIEIGSHNTFGDGTVIGDNNEVVINQNNNTVNYQGDKENAIVLKKISPILIKKYGKKKIGIVGFVSLISSLITIFSWMSSFSAPKTFPSVLDFEILDLKLLFFSMILLIMGVSLLSILSYHSSTKCKNCNKEFAYEEYKDPIIQEIKTSKGIIKTTTRYYRCKFCGDKEIRKTKTIIDDKT